MQVAHNRQYPKEWWPEGEERIRSNESERLDLEMLIRGYTFNGAYQLRIESEVGSIEKGKDADRISARLFAGMMARGGLTDFQSILHWINPTP